MFEVKIVQPKTLAELWRCLPGLRGPKAFLSGGTDLVVAAQRGWPVPPVWVDLSQIPDLRRIELRRDHLWIGGRVTYADLEESSLVKKWAPALHGVCRFFAVPPIRTLATVAGNVANASPAADGVVGLMAEEAVVVARRGSAVRRIPLDRFYTGFKKTARKPDEVILGLEIPRHPHLGSFQKIAPRANLGIAKAAVAVCAEPADGSFRRVRVALGAVAPVVMRARRTEEVLEGRSWEERTLEEAAEAASAECAPITDHRSTAEYRRAMVRVLLKRACRALSARP